MVKEDIAFYQTATNIENTDITDILSLKQLKELGLLAIRPDEKDAIKVIEFNKAIKFKSANAIKTLAIGSASNSPLNNRNPKGSKIIGPFRKIKQYVISENILIN